MTMSRAGQGHRCPPLGAAQGGFCNPQQICTPVSPTHLQTWASTEAEAGCLGAPSTHGVLPNLSHPTAGCPPARRVAQVGAEGTALGCLQPHRAQLPPPARTHGEESGAGRGGRKSSEAGAGAAGPAARRHAIQRQPRERRGNATAESRSWSLPSSIFVRAEEVAEPRCRRHLPSKARLGSEPRAWHRRHPAQDGATVTPRDGSTSAAPQNHTQHPNQLATGLRV